MSLYILLNRVMKCSHLSTALCKPLKELRGRSSSTPADCNPSIRVWQAIAIIPTDPGSCDTAGTGGGSCESITNVANIELILQCLTKIKTTTIVANDDNTEQTTIKMFAKNFGSNGICFLFVTFLSIFIHFVNHTEHICSSI